MVRPNIEEVRNLGDFQTVFNWEVTFSTIPKDLSGDFGKYRNELNARAQTASLPSKQNPTIPVTLHGFKTNQPGFTEFEGTLELTFVEGINAVIQKFFQAWQDLNFDMDTGKQATKPNREALIVLTPLDNENKATRTYEIIGCWCENFVPGNLDGAAQDTLKPSATIRYDYFKTK